VVLSEVYFDEDAPADAWIELFNRSDVPLNVGGLQIQLNFGVVGAIWALPLGTEIAARGHLLAGPASSTRSDLDVRWPSDLGVPLGVGTRVGLLTADPIQQAIGFPWLDGGGKAYAFDPGTALANLHGDDAWCSAIRLATSGEFGSPGGPNDACSARFASSTLIITEVMPEGNPLPFGDERWFEVVYFGDTQDFAGLTIDVDGRKTLIESSAVFEDGAHVVFALETANLPNRSFVAVPGLTLPAEGALIRVLAGTWDLTGLLYGPAFGYSTGRSGAVRPGPYADVDYTDAARWCPSADTYGAVVPQFGSPGSASGACAE
jgi:hypothetical protein